MEYYNNRIYYFYTNYQVINIYKVTISFIILINVQKIIIWENVCKRMKKLQVKEKLIILNNNDIW